MVRDPERRDLKQVDLKKNFLSAATNSMSVSEDIWSNLHTQRQEYKIKSLKNRSGTHVIPAAWYSI